MQTEHKNNHAIKINYLQTQTNRIEDKAKSFSILGSQIADQALIETFENLEKEAHKNGIYELLFNPELDTIVCSRPKLRPSTNTPEKFADNLTLHMERIEKCVLNKSFKSLIKNITPLDKKKLEVYFANIYNPLAIVFSDEIEKQSEKLINMLINFDKKNSWKESYGQLQVTANQLLEKGISPDDYKKIRTEVASRCLPRGLGYTSIYEYQLFITDYVFLSREFKNAQLFAEEYLSYKLKIEYENKLGIDAQLLWNIVKDIVYIRFIIFENEGTKKKKLRSVKSIMDSYACSENIAKAVIDVLDKMPKYPAEDILQFRFIKCRIKNSQCLKKFEFEVFHNSNLNKIEWRWSGNIAEKIALLKRPFAADLMQKIAFLSRIHLSEIELQKFANNTFSYSLREVLASQLLNKKKSGLYIDSINRIIGGSFIDFASSRELLNYFEHKKKSLSRIKVIYDNLLKATKEKPQILNWILSYQQDYLLSGDENRLKTLTKSHIVKQMGYLPSSDYNKNSNNKQNNLLANNGRRLERYMKNTLFRFKGQIISFDKLIPGNGGVKNIAGGLCTQYQVKAKISALIAGEDKLKPYSDKKIVELLKENYAIRIAVKTVNKYRNDLGIKSSQGRRSIDSIP